LIFVGIGVYVLVVGEGAELGPEDGLVAGPEAGDADPDGLVAGPEAGDADPDGLVAGPLGAPLGVDELLGDMELGLEVVVVEVLWDSNCWS
jgi:hypothetical protein